MVIAINVEHLVAHVHRQNGLAESFIKRIQLIARPLLMKSKLPITAWGHAILHAVTLICIRPKNYHDVSPLELVFGKQPKYFPSKSFWMCSIYSNCSITAY